MQISIITINLNNAKGLKETVKSVLSQSYRSFEFIIIDGNSNDNSLEVINKYKKSICFWVSEEDNGIYQAMNKGIKVAKGEYLLFLNSGDVLNGNKAIENYVNHPNFKGDVIYGNYKFEKGEKIYPEKLTPLHFFNSSLPHQSSFIKKELFSKFGFYDENYKIVSDKAFFIKCFLSKKVVFKHINIALSICDLDGISNTNHQLVKEENNAILKSLFGIYYEDYIKHLELKKSYNKLKKETLKGITKRIKNKFFR